MFNSATLAVILLYILSAILFTSTTVSIAIYYARKKEREREARKEYRLRRSQKADIRELFILDIMREEMKNDDPRLF